MEDLGDLRALIERGDVADRAFVDANLRMAWSRTADADVARRTDLVALHRSLADAAKRAHAEVREHIARGELRGASLRRLFDARPSSDREHFVEEVLGVAYPPLAERALGRELVAYTPSGWEEIVHALDVTKLSASDRFLDIGAGTGKVVLLAALLTGASSAGIECESPLVDVARTAAGDLGIAHRARIDQGDARDTAIPLADVVFMYVPFTGETFARVMERVMACRPHFVCTAPLDLERRSEFAALAAIGSPCSWLQVYARR